MTASCDTTETAIHTTENATGAPITAASIIIIVIILSITSGYSTITSKEISVTASAVTACPLKITS